MVSAARRPQQQQLISVPVSVITSEDIHYSGLTTLPEILQFAPGVDVVMVDRNRYALGIRGLHQSFADRTLTLINGRDATSPAVGGTDFGRLPLFMEDIDHIEVVRGPASAAWGANALNGVINIVTQRPEAVQGVLATTTFTEFGDSYTHTRWGSHAGNWNWKFSFGYLKRFASDDVIDNNNFLSRDFSNEHRLDTEATFQASEATRLSFGIGYTLVHRGAFEFVGFYPDKNEKFMHLRPFLRVDHEFESGRTGYLQWFANLEDVDRPSAYKARTAENDLEGQLNFDMGAHRFSAGGNFRWIRINTSSVDAQDFRFSGDPFDEFFTGIFLIDQWEATNRLTFEAQFRGDYYSETETDGSGRLTALMALDAERDHVFRISGARAFRTPMLLLRDGQFSHIPLPSPPLPPNTFAVELKDLADLDNESVWSSEAGYSGNFGHGLHARVNGFYLWYKDLIGAFVASQTPVTNTFALRNNGDAESHGVEVELSWKRSWGSLSAWYAYTDFDEEGDFQDLRAFRPAPHKAGLTFRAFLPGHWIFNLNHKYSDVTNSPPNSPSDTLERVQAFHRLDFTLTKAVADGKGEFLVGVSDALDETEFSVQDFGSFTSHPTPGRTLFFRFQVQF